MVDSAALHFPTQLKEVNDCSAGVFNAFLGIGQVLAPCYGSLMVTNYGFRVTMDWAAIIAISFALIYFIFGGGVQAIKQTCSDRKQVVRSENLQ